MRRFTRSPRSLLTWILLLAPLVASSAPAAAPPEIAQKQAAFAAVKEPGQRRTLGRDLALALIVAGQTDDARAVLDRVLKDGPDSETYHLKALTYTGRPPIDAESAVKVLKKGLESLPDDVNLWLDLGEAYRSGKNYKDSIATYERILAKHPQEVRALYGEADTYLMAQQYEDARKAVQKALDMNPKEPQSLYYMGKVVERDRGPGGSVRGGIMWYRKAIAAEPTTRYYAALLIANLVIGEIPDFTAALNELKKSTPGDASVSVAEGILSESRGQSREALERYRSAVAQDPGCAFAHFALANYFAGTGNYHPFVHQTFTRLTPFNPSEALGHIAAIRFIDPSFPYVDQLEARLGSQMPPGAPTHPEDAKTKDAERQWHDYFHTLWVHH